MKRILIAEDNPGFADFLATALRLTGCSVTLVGDGAAAVERFAESSHDLVLLDVLMPGESGLAACERIRALPGGDAVPIVMLSGVYRKQTDRQEALKLGATDYLFKPVSVSEVWRLVGEHLGIQCQLVTEQGRQALPAPSSEWLDEAVDLRERPLAVTLHELQRRSKTGLLFVNEGTLTHVLFIERGRLVFVRSNDADQRLGRVLRKLGRVTEEQHDEAVRRMHAGRGPARLGETLVELGALTREQLHDALQHQLEGLVVQAFQSRSGSSRFVEGELPSREEVKVELDTDNLILKGIRAMPDASVFTRHLPPPETVLRPVPTTQRLLAQLQLTSFERQVFSLVDGTKTVERIRSIGRLGQVSVERMLFIFLNTGLVEAGEKAGSTNETPSDAGRAARGQLERAPVPRLLAALHRTGRSGVLTLTNERHETWLYFDAGKIVFVGSNDTHQRLGEILVEGELITQAELDDASEVLTERRGEGLRLGQVLLEQGRVTLEELQWALICQMQRRIQTVFEWEKGRYRFEPGPFPTDESIVLDYDTRDVVLEGVRRIDPYVAFRHLPDVRLSVRRPEHWASTARALALTSPERRFLEALDDRFRLTEPLDSDAFDPELTVKCLLGFLSVGLLELEVGDGSEEETANEAGAVAETEPEPVGA